MSRHPWPFSGGFEFQSASKFDAKARKHVTSLAIAGVRNVIEVKEDGWRVLLVKPPEGSGEGARCYSRGISKVTGTYRDLLEDGHLKCLEDHVVMPGSAIEGELIWPGHRAAQVPTALKEHRDELKFVAFGFPYYEGERVLGWKAQRDLLNEEEYVTTRVFGFGAHTLASKELDSYAKEWDIEGWIVKVDHPSHDEWYKVKREITLDVIVLDTKDAEFGVTGKFDGMVGSLLVGVVCVDHDARGAHDCWKFPDGMRVREVANVSGMDDEEREKMTAERDDLPGRVCEIECQAVGTHERLRHPRFNRWREDKPAEQCTGTELGPQLRATLTREECQPGDWRWSRWNMKSPHDGAKRVSGAASREWEDYL